MKNKLFLMGMFSIVLVFGILIAGCDNGSTSSHSYNNDAGSLEGTWRGTVMGSTATVTISNSGWTVSVPSYSYYDTGSFNRKGNSAVLYAATSGNNVGTASIIDDNTISLVLNSNSIAPGTYTLTRY